MWNLNTRQKSLPFSLIAVRVVLVCSYKSNCCSWVCWMFVASSVIKTLWMQIKLRRSIYCNRTTPLTCDPFDKHAGGQPAFSTASGSSRFMPSVEHFWKFFCLALLRTLQYRLLLQQQPTVAVAHHPPFHLLQEAYAVLTLLMCWYQVFPVSPCNGTKTAGLKMWMFFLYFGGLRFKLKFNRNCPNNMTSEASSTHENYPHVWVMRFIFTGMAMLQQILMQTELHCSEDAILRSHILVFLQEWAK